VGSENLWATAVQFQKIAVVAAAAAAVAAPALPLPLLPFFLILPFLHPLR